jgi:N-acetylmuramoyl-L-alanine amidase
MKRKAKLYGILAAVTISMAALAVARLWEVPFSAVGVQPAQPLCIYLDAGHVGFDLGASGRLPEGDSLPEKELVLDVALACGERLALRGHRVIYSRTGDERLTYTTAADEVRARRASAKAQGADLIISVHANAYAGDGRAYGARVYYNPASDVSRTVAERMAAAISQHTGAHLGRECRIVADETYYMLGDAALPAVLVELGFLSDETECALLAEKWYRTALASALAEGVR